MGKPNLKSKKWKPQDLTEITQNKTPKKKLFLKKECLTHMGQYQMTYHSNPRKKKDGEMEQKKYWREKWPKFSLKIDERPKPDIQNF